MSLPNLTSAAAEPVLGVLGDVWSRSAVIVGGGLVYACALALVAASAGFAWLLVAFLVMYPATGAFVSLSQASLMDAEPGRREPSMV